MEKEQRDSNARLLEWFSALLTALTIALLCLVFLFRTGRVDGTSMQPTLDDGDQVVARSIFYTPKRQDVVIIDGFIDYGKPLVKRVIGIEGDIVDIDFDTGEVYVNGTRLIEPYISGPTTQQYGVNFPITVPKGHIFLLGDNRPLSKDSRDSEIGMIKKEDVLGKVIFVIFPLSKFGEAI